MDPFGDAGNGELRPEVIVERDRGGEESLEGGLLHRFGRGALVTGVEVIVEEGAEVYLVERIGRSGRLDRLAHYRIGDGQIHRRLRRGCFTVQIGDIARRSIGARRIHHRRFQDVILGVEYPLAFQKRHQLFRCNLFA